MSSTNYAEKLIDVYLAWLLSTDADAGWHQPSMLQRLIEFKGDIPPPTGNDSADVKMISEVRYLRNPHALLPEAKRMISRLPDRHRTCLLVHAMCSGTYDRMGKRWTERRISTELGLSVRQYRHYREAGLEKLVEQLEPDSKTG